MINRSRSEWFHLDIMDGVFVPNLSYGIPVTKALRNATEKVIDAHLMIVRPERYIKAFGEAGADYLTVHAEASTHLHRTIESIHEEGMKAGVALNPHTPVSTLEEIVEIADLILIMSVNPGFGGQKFIPSMLDKISRAKELILRKNSRALLQADGGVNTENAGAVFKAGADVLVAGNAIFNSEDPILTIDKLLTAE